MTNVDYYTNGVFWSRSGVSPYQLYLTNLPAGSNRLTAVAMDNKGFSATSPDVHVTVLPQLPVVFITSPQSSSVFSLGEPIVIQATATDADSRIANLMIVTNGSPFTITATRGFQEAMVTAGGIALREVDPRTLESKIVPNLFLTGEVLDLTGPSGGYNLQLAFSTGHLAGATIGQRL